MRIGIDLMGSDSPPKVLYEAVLQAAEQYDPSYTFVVLGTQDAIDNLGGPGYSFLASARTARIEFHLIQDYITMGDEPLSAVRLKKGSSLVRGIWLLKKQMLDAFVSAGNTGALITSATLSLPMLPGINRPALLATLPTQKGSVAVIDVGGNVYCKAHHLIQFAHMAAVYQRCSRNITCPKVGLLNIGVESRKGTSELRQAYQTLEALNDSWALKGGEPPLQFIGNVEGRDIFDGKVDVLVTDGFTGNVLLKTAEGVSSFIFDYLKDTFNEVGSNKVKHTLKDMQRQFNYAEYPGAIVCGVEGVVVKCHGHSSSRAMYNGIRGAINLVSKQLVKQIKSNLTV